jgi:hypothetical protein
MGKRVRLIRCSGVEGCMCDGKRCVHLSHIGG